MKIISILFLILFIFQKNSYSQFLNLNPVPDGNKLWSTYFIDESTGWIVGSEGFIIKTTNGGITWTKQNSGVLSDLKSVRFVSENVGFICGDEGTFLKTTDSGNSWLKLFTGTDLNLNALSFIDTEKIFVVGENSIILKTTDSGISWSSGFIGNSYNLKSLIFVNDSVGYTVSLEGKLFKTSNGGLSWFDKSPDILDTNLIIKFNSVFFLNTDTGWIGIGDDNLGNGKILSTTDGGETWTQNYVLSFERTNKIFHKDKEGPDFSYGIRDIYFIDKFNGFAVAGTDGGWNRTILTTTDGGENWMVKYYTLEENPLLSVYVTDSGIGIAVGTNGSIFRTVNYGQNWVQIFSGGSVSYGGEERICDIHFINDSVGFAGGLRNSFVSSETGQLILKTTNGVYFGKQIYIVMLVVAKSRQSILLMKILDGRVRMILF